MDGRRGEPRGAAPRQHPGRAPAGDRHLNEFDEIPTLTTARLLLRAFTPADARPLYEIMEERDVLRYFPSPLPPAYERVRQLVQEQLEHWQEHGYGWWALEVRRAGGASRAGDAHQAGDARRADAARRGTFIGWAGLQYLPDTDETEVGYLLGSAYWGQGLATEAARASVRYGFEELGLPEIVGIVHPDNVASQRVLEKAGLSRVERTVYFNMECYRYVARRSRWSGAR